MFVIDAGGNREGADIPLSMIVNGMHIRREDRLGMIVDGHGGIGPPQEGLREGGPVIQLSPDLDIGLARIERDAHHALGAVHLIDLGEFYTDAPVRILAGPVIGGGKSGGTVVLRPVKLNAAGNPGAGQADQGRFDDLVVIDKVVVVGLVIGALNASAQLRENHDTDVLIFKPDGGIRPVLFDIENFINDRKRVHLSAASLIHAFFKEHGIPVCLSDTVCRNDHGFNFNACWHDNPPQCSHLPERLCSLSNCRCATGRLLNVDPSPQLFR